MHTHIHTHTHTFTHTHTHTHTHTQKRGGNNTAWQERYFVLNATEHILYYYLDEKSFRLGKSERGSIPLILKGGGEGDSRPRGGVWIEILLSGPLSYQFALHSATAETHAHTHSHTHSHTHTFTSTSLDESEGRVYFLQTASRADMDRYDV